MPISKYKKSTSTALKICSAKTLCKSFCSSLKLHAFNRDTRWAFLSALHVNGIIYIIVFGSCQAPFSLQPLLMGYPVSAENSVHFLLLLFFFQMLFPLPFPPSPSFFLPSTLPFSERVGPLWESHLSSTSRLDTSSPAEARQAAIKIKLHMCYYVPGGLVPACVCSLFSDSDSDSS